MRKLALLLVGLSFLGLSHPNTVLAQDLSASEAIDNLRKEMREQFQRQAVQIEQLRREIDTVGKRPGFTLVAGGTVDMAGNAVEKFGPLDFVSKGEGAYYTVRFIGAPTPSKPPFILIGSTLGK
jgi:hypothetical protein